MCFSLAWASRYLFIVIQQKEHNSKSNVTKSIIIRYVMLNSFVWPLARLMYINEENVATTIGSSSSSGLIKNGHALIFFLSDPFLLDFLLYSERVYLWTFLITLFGHPVHPAMPFSLIFWVMKSSSLWFGSSSCLCPSWGHKMFAIKSQMLELGVTNIWTSGQKMEWHLAKKLVSSTGTYLPPDQLPYLQ